MNTCKIIRSTILISTVLASIFAAGNAAAQQYAAGGELLIRRIVDDFGQYVCEPAPYGTGATITFHGVTVPSPDLPGGFDCPMPSNLHTMTVRFRAADADIGRLGGVGIVAVDPSVGPVAYFAKGAWRPIDDRNEDFEPVAVYDSMPDSADFTLPAAAFTTCLQRNGAYDVYVGYGILTDAQRNRINTFYRIKTPRLTPEHLARVFIEHDAESNRKYAKVLTMNCGGTTNQGYM